MNIQDFDHLPAQRQNELWIEYMYQAGIPPRVTLPFLRWLKAQHE